MQRMLTLIPIFILAVLASGCAEGTGATDFDNFLLAKRAHDSPKTLPAPDAAGHRTILIVEIINTADPLATTQEEEILVTGITLHRVLSNTAWRQNFNTRVLSEADEQLPPFPLVGQNQDTLTAGANIEVFIPLNPPVYLRAGDRNRIHIMEEIPNVGGNPILQGTLRYEVRSLTARYVGSTSSVTVRSLDGFQGIIARSPLFGTP